MRANIPYLVVAIALLWLPRNWLRLGISLWRRRSRKERPRTSLDASGLSFQREFTKPRNYLDFLRAAIGALALIGGFGIEAVLQREPNTPSEVARQIFGIQAAVLLIGLLIQTVRYERKLSLSAPVFFIAGMLIALCPPWAVVCGLVIAWLLTPIMPNVSAYLVVQAAVTAGMSFILQGIGLRSLLGGALCMVPVVLSFLVRQPLIVLSRTSVSGTRE